MRDILKILRSRTLIALYCKVPNQTDKHEHQSKLTKFHQISPKLTKVSSNWQTFVVCIPFYHYETYEKKLLIVRYTDIQISPECS